MLVCPETAGRGAGDELNEQARSDRGAWLVRLLEP